MSEMGTTKVMADTQEKSKEKKDRFVRRTGQQER
jgi:hypothetical protein